MKKIVFLLLVLFAVANLQGCANTAKSTENGKDSGSNLIVDDKNTSSTDESSSDSSNLPQSVSSESSEIESNTESDSSTPDESNKSVDDNVVITTLEQRAKELTKKTGMKLIKGYKVIDAVNGDLNSDGRSDLAVVVEEAPGEELGSRTLYVLLQNSNGSYTVKHSNSKLIFGSTEGGQWGDPFLEIQIQNQMLSAREFGGSSFRWQYIDRFKYVDGEFDQTTSTSMYYYTESGYGYQEDYDYIHKTVKYTSCSPDNKDYQPKLIYSDVLPDGKRTFESVDYDNQPDYEIRFLPSLGYYEYDKRKNMMDLKISANKALDLVKNKINSEMKKSPILWTEETKANYSSLVFYNVPDYYYTNDKGILYYSDIEEQDGKFKHNIVLFDNNDNTTFYTVDDSTGAVEKED